MRVAIFGAKYKNNLDDFRKQCRESLTGYGIKTVDESYFESTREHDIEDPSIFKNVEKSILKADAVVFELSRKSDGIGMIMGMAYANNKPTLILYNKERRTIPFSAVAIASTGSKKTDVIDYTDETLPSILGDFVKKVKDSKGVKFLTTLPFHQAKYINWFVFNHGVTKIDVIRRLIDQDIDANEEYKSFLKEE